MSIKIAGTGSYLPERKLTNSDLEKMVDTNDEWIRTRTGIIERRISTPQECASDLAKPASERALEAAGISADQLSVIIVSTTTPDHIFPNTACCLQHKIGAKNAFCFDLSAACSGFIYGLQVAVSLLKTNKNYRYALVCGSEKLSGIVDWDDRNTCVLFGDGAGAMVLEKVDDGIDDILPASCLASDGQHSQTLIVPSSGSAMPITHERLDEKLNCIHMAGQETFKLAINSMVSASLQLLQETGHTIDDLALVIPHQANRRIIQVVASRLGVDKDKMMDNIEYRGNTSSATIGIAFDEAVRSGRLRRGDLVLLTAFGSGLTWGSLLLRY
jgi:3-oxoacyl-[acyl-carrier-protein] synthase-3